MGSGNAPRDVNRVPALIGVSNSDLDTAVPVAVDPSTHRLLVQATISGSASDGALLDGANSSIKATVKDLANSNPLTTQIVDANGDAITSFGGGTQYTNGAATVANPIGTMPVFDNAGTVSKVSSTVGLPVQIIGGGGGGLSVTDAAAWTAASSAFTPSGGVFNDSAAALTSGQQGTERLTPNRGLHINLRNNSGTEIGTSTTPIQVSLANTAANATAVKVDGSAVTQPVSAAALPLPSGAATSAKQPALGTAGSASTDVITVQGIASGTAQPISGTVTANAGTGNMGANITQLAGTTIDTNSGVKSAGTQRIVIATDQPNLTTPLNVNNAQMNGVAVTMGNGASGTGVQRVTIASDSTANIATIGTSVTPGTAAANLGKAEDAAHSSGDVGVMGLGVRNDGAAATFSSADGDYTPQAVDAQGRIYTAQKAPTATLTNVAASASSVTVLAANTGRLGATIYNDSSATLYLKYGSAASATSFTVKLNQDDVAEVNDGYTGIITGLWSSATGTARVTERT